MEDMLMGLEVEIRWAVDPHPLMVRDEAEATIRRVCQAVADKEELGAAELSLSLVGEGEIKELNRMYRGKDAPTDVLSFSLLEGDEPEILDEEAPLALGDIVICWRIMAEQAREYGHSTTRELAFLTAHGMYHLLGYDHGTQEDEQVMTALQEEVLMSLGITR